ncbi:MAG TPA: hypothetical protein PKD05_04540, partial [Candidatus Melainabacteria bacterium]|nr:hypothetical protein [Candidatus Melainabacteria bacterium]
MKFSAEASDTDASTPSILTLYALLSVGRFLPFAVTSDPRPALSGLMAVTSGLTLEVICHLKALPASPYAWKTIWVEPAV